jgi:LPS-assembly protein
MKALRFVLALLFCATARANISLSSNKVIYDPAGSVITAEGDVVIRQAQSDKGIRELRTDRVEYYQKTGIIKLSGKSRIREPTGEIIAANDVRIDDSFKKAIVKALVIILNDDSRIKAKSGQKNQDIYTLHSASYTPCIETPCSFPLWDLTADRVTYDSNKKTLTYSNVALRMKGIPILFSPYLRHASFGVKRQTGFLAPIISSKNDTGLFVGIPYYVVLARDKDLKLTPFFNSKGRGLASCEYRQSFKNGDFVTSTSILTNSDSVNANKYDKNTRWHVDSTFTSYGLQNKKLLLRVNRASDVTYKSKYPIDGSQQLLPFWKQKYNESKLSLELFDECKFITVDSRVFQTQNKQTAPIILPHVHIKSVKNDVIGGAIEFDSDTTYLTRNEDVSANFRKNFFRSTNEVRWKRTVRADSVILDFIAGTRNDVYKINDDDKIFQSASAQASAFVPIVKCAKGNMSIFGPKLSISSFQSFSKRRRLNSNEDSVFQSVNDLNFYKINRNGIYDQVEEGEHLDIGFENSSYNSKRRWLNVFVGNTCRISRHDKSAFVGRISLRPNDTLSFRTRFVGERSADKPKMFESGIMSSIGRISTCACYIHNFSKNDIRKTNVSQIGLSANIKLTRFWKLALSKIFDLERKAKTMSHGIFVSYEDECFGIGFGVSRSNFKDRDVKPHTGFIFTVMFKNLGNFSRTNSATQYRPELTNVE